MGRGPIISSVFRDRGQMRQRQQTPNPQGSQRADGVDAAVETRHARQRDRSAVTDLEVGAVDTRQAAKGETAAADGGRGIGEAGELRRVKRADAKIQIDPVQAGLAIADASLAVVADGDAGVVIGCAVRRQAGQSREVDQAAGPIGFEGDGPLVDLRQRVQIHHAAIQGVDIHGLVIGRPLERGQIWQVDPAAGPVGLNRTALTAALAADITGDARKLRHCSILCENVDGVDTSELRRVKRADAKIQIDPVQAGQAIADASLAVVADGDAGVVIGCAVRRQAGQSREVDQAAGPIGFEGDGPLVDLRQRVQIHHAAIQGVDIHGLVIGRPLERGQIWQVDPAAGPVGLNRTALTAALAADITGDSRHGKCRAGLGE